MTLNLSPVPDVEWISPKSQVIKNTPGRYEISDFGRVLTIPRAEADFEGFYFCKGKGKTHSEIHSVFLNVTCKFLSLMSNRRINQWNCILYKYFVSIQS